MFRKNVIWQGIVYAILMALAKSATGICTLLPASLRVKDILEPFKRCINRRWRKGAIRKRDKEEGYDSDSHIDSIETDSDCVSTSEHPDSQIQNSDNSWRAAILVAFAMTVRGEIGFLAAGVSQSVGVMDPPEVFLVVIWGIVLCTLFGAMGVGFIARKIERTETHSGSKIALLGKWR